LIIYAVNPNKKHRQTSDFTSMLSHTGNSHKFEKSCVTLKRSQYMNVILKLQGVQYIFRPLGPHILFLPCCM